MQTAGEIVLLASLSIAAGCASIVSKSSYRLPVSSSEDNVAVTVYSESGRRLASVRAPTTIALPAGDGYFKPAKYKFVFGKEGFKDAETHIEAEFDPWYLGNIGFGGLVGMLIVDPLTGAMWKFDERKPVYCAVERMAGFPDSLDLKAIQDLHGKGGLSDDEYNLLRMHIDKNKPKQ